jgi:hypothetical protein
MLEHEFVDMPGRSTEIGDNPYVNTMLLRCKWCMKSPTKAREDGCAKRELEQMGSIVLSLFNPDAIERFGNRICVTCNSPIMSHYMKRGSSYYWCNLQEPLYSLGMSQTEWDIPEGFGQTDA